MLLRWARGVTICLVSMYQGECSAAAAPPPLDTTTTTSIERLSCMYDTDLVVPLDAKNTRLVLLEADLKTIMRKKQRHAMRTHVPDKQGFLGACF